MTETKPKRRWFRFSLRTLLIVVTIIGIVLAWRAHELRLIRQRDKLITWIMYKGTDTYISSCTFSGPEEAPWRVRLWGEWLSTPQIRVDEGKMKPDDQGRLQQIRELLTEVQIAPVK